MKVLASLFTITSLTVALMGSALAADKCKNFDIKILNSSGYQAKVTKFEYYDYDKTKWRTESLTQRKLNNNIQWTWNRGLEHVKDDSTKFKVTWKIAAGPAGAWITQSSVNTNKFTCRSNGSKLVTLQ